VTKFLFVLVNSVLIAFNIIDVKFFEFEGKRLTGDFFTKEWLGDDFVTLLPEFIRDYWYMFLISFLFFYILIKKYPVGTYKEQDSNIDTTDIKDKIKQLVIGVLIVGLGFVFARGGLELKPIGVITAARYSTPKHMALVLNSPFTIIKTINRRTLKEYDYYSDKELDSIYSPIHKYNAKEGFRKKNIVIIILESFGREYSGFLNDTVGYTPNLDSIMHKGLVFRNAYANGRRSIEALPSIFSSLPSLMDRAFVNTQFVSNSIDGLGSILGREGYETSFFHGGKNGTMGFDNFTKLAGIEKYYGKREYGNLKDYDGNWGIFDEPYLQYFSKEISKMKEPFFTSVFTLSSHHPYTIPVQYKNKFPKGELINTESIGYADYALGEFFKTASKQKWFNNTLFVLTADHTAQAKKNFYKTSIGRYAIPIIFYAPGDTTIRGVSDLVCQQSDIMPSILDYLNYSNPFVAFGNSVFVEDSNSFAISYLSGIYQLINTKIAISFDGERVIKAIDVDSVKKDKEQKVDSLYINKAERLIKGIIQQYNYRMNNNILKVED
jgi:phosphoglycerol transferase MdoB-like AlkP superfamily enzyme